MTTQKLNYDLLYYPYGIPTCCMNVSECLKDAIWFVSDIKQTYIKQKTCYVFKAVAFSGVLPQCHIVHLYAEQ